jgi:sugar phosphate isomerase/epimerase
MKLVLHSVSYAGLWRGQKYLSLDEFIKKASKLGYDGIELMAKRPHASLLDLSKEDRIRIRASLEENNLECACIAGYTDFTSGMDSKLIPITEMQIEHVTNLAKLAYDLGCKIVRVFTGYECPGVPYWEQWDCCVRSLKECSRRAAEYGVNIGIQNHHDIGVDAYSLRELIRDVDEPNCKAMFDAWSPALRGDDLTESVGLVSDYTIYTTVADYIRLPRYHYMPDLVNYKRQDDLLKAVPMGEGFIDYKTFFHALKSIGFDGYAAYEMCSELQGGGSEENLDAYAKKFVDYMKELRQID